MLQKTVSICVLVVIVLLVFRAGDLSAGARDFIQDWLMALTIAVQQN